MEEKVYILVLSHKEFSENIFTASSKEEAKRLCNELFDVLHPMYLKYTKAWKEYWAKVKRFNVTKDANIRGLKKKFNEAVESNNWPEVTKARKQLAHWNNAKPNIPKDVEYTKDTEFSCVEFYLENLDMNGTKDEVVKRWMDDLLKELNINQFDRYITRQIEITKKM